MQLVKAALMVAAALFITDVASRGLLAVYTWSWLLLLGVGVICVIVAYRTAFLASPQLPIAKQKALASALASTPAAQRILSSAHSQYMAQRLAEAIAIPTVSFEPSTPADLQRTRNTSLVSA